MGEAALDHLLQALDLVQLAPDHFVARDEGVSDDFCLFGGLVAAQSLRAAQRTVRTDVAVHALHGHFLREGRTGEPLDLVVQRLRDSRSFATRQVTASQHGVTIFTTTASFHRREEGPDRGRPISAVAPGPVPSRHRPTPWDDYVPRRPFEVIELSALATPATAEEPGRCAWTRTVAPAPDDPALHACLLTYVSDFATAFVAVRNVASPLDTVVATLNHSIWFHRPGRIDEWVYVDMRPENNGGNRGLVSGTVHTHGGVHLATLTQEALVRPRRPAPGGAGAGVPLISGRR